jgi:hypothetical protein
LYVCVYIYIFSILGASIALRLRKAVLLVISDDRIAQLLCKTEYKTIIYFPNQRIIQKKKKVFFAEMEYVI